MVRRGETDPAGRSAIRKFAARLVGLENKVDGLAKGRLGSSSLEAAAIDSYNEEGTLTGVIGQQYDGATGVLSVNGPPPPAPSAPTLTPVPTGVMVTYDGTFADSPETVAPSDFSHFEVHASTANSPGILFTTLKGQIGSARGGQVLVLSRPDEPIYAWIAARTLSGKVTLGLVAGPVAGGHVTAESIDPDVIANIGGNTIYRQDTAPAGPHKIGDLWLDTPENIPYRWEGDPGSWVASRDVGIAEAIDAAFDADSKAVQAGLDALAAQGAASNAQTTANNATTLAGLKTTTFRQSTQPATTGRTVGDVWIDTANGNRVYVWGANNQWNLSTIGAEGLSVTARQLGAITTYRQANAPTSGMILGDFWIDSDDNKLYRYEGTTPTWVAVQDAGIQAAINSANNAAALADGKMRTFIQATAPTGLVAGDDGDLWIDTDDGNRLYSWNGTTLGWVSRRIGTGAIEPNSLVARDVIATGTISAALFEAVIVLASTIVAGSPTAAHVEIDSRGIILFTVGPDGLPTESGALGTGDDGLTFTDPVTKSTNTSVTRTGVAAQQVDVAGIDADGDGAPDSGFRIYGQEFTDYLWALPRGIVAQGVYSDPGSNMLSGVTTRVAIGEMSFTAKAGRAYRVQFTGLHYVSSAGYARPLHQIRGTEDGTTPTITNGSCYMGQWFDVPVGSSSYSAPPLIFDKVWSTTADVEVRMVYVAERWNGETAGATISVTSGTPADRYYNPLRWSVSDIGPAVSDTFQLNNGGGDTNNGGTASPTAKKTYTTTWQANWEASFEDGVKRTDTDIYQGTYGGKTYKGYAGFTAGAEYSTSPSDVGKTIVQATTGATITKVEVKLHCNHSYSVSGGTAKIGYHGQVSEPSTNAPAGAFEILSKFFKRGDTIWVNLPSLTYADWKSGNYRGVVLGPGGDYMRFDGAGTDRPAIRITYTR